LEEWTVSGYLLELKLVDLGKLRRKLRLLREIRKQELTGVGGQDCRGKDGEYGGCYICLLIEL
jgi:hypothetical protein